MIGSWEQQRFNDWEQRRFDAAHAETHELLKLQHAMSRRHPNDRIQEIDPSKCGPWLAGLQDRFLSLLGEPGLKVCLHLSGPLAMHQPLFYRVWRPGLRCLRHCEPPQGISAPAAWPCFRCDEPAGEPLFIQTYQLGMVACYFGLCLPCLEKTQAEMAESGSHQGDTLNSG